MAMGFSVIRSIYRLARDESGIAAIQIALLVAVLLGFSGLAIDLGRAFTVNTELQQAADAAALAAAAELDGFTGAIARATTAACGVVSPGSCTAGQSEFGSNKQTFAAAGSGTVTISAITFLSGTACGTPPCPPTSTTVLPPVPSPAGDSTTTDDVDAAYVRVVTQTSSVTAMLASFITGNSTFRTVAVATAGRIATECLDVPLMMCNPLDTGIGNQLPTIAVGSQILVSDGGGGSLVPGNWGLICPPDDAQCGGRTFGNYIGTAGSGASQCTQDVLGSKPGATVGPVGNFNTRFGINPTVAMPPDVNVTPYPQDVGTVSSSGTDQPTTPISTTNRIGDGKWNPGTYWTAAVSAGGGGHSGSYPPTGSTLTTTSTRYDVYKWEIANNQIPVPPTGAVAAATNRRLINMAIVNCLSENVAGRWRGPGVGFMQVFATGPDATTPNTTSGNMYFEVVKQFSFSDPTGPIHNHVQLVR
jgi:Flp pilus assembly protein TadG